jgi:hypothetical protein
LEGGDSPSFFFSPFSVVVFYSSLCPDLTTKKDKDFSVRTTVVACPIPAGRHAIHRPILRVVAGAA